MNIPIYRAKKIDSDEYIEGYYYYDRIATIPEIPMHMINFLNSGKSCQIDPKTLAIHFPGMLDKNGKKIFASLSEDGIGGDILKGNRLDFAVTLRDFNRVTWLIFEVTGVHKGEQL